MHSSALLVSIIAAYRYIYCRGLAMLTPYRTDVYTSEATINQRLKLPASVKQLICTVCKSE
jgi:hypothetical protein